MVPHDRLSRCYGTLLQTLHYLAPATVWFYRLHLLFLLFVGLVGGAIVYAIEADIPPHHYIDCAFIMTGAVTGGGLQTFDVAPLAGGSQALIFIASLIGGSVFLSAAPATYRRIVIWRAARLALRCTTDRDPRLAGYLTTHLEYRALGWVRALVLIYWAAVQIAVWLALGTYFAVFPGAAALAVRSGVGPLWFSAFVTVTGFANVGLVPLVSGRSSGGECQTHHPASLVFPACSPTASRSSAVTTLPCCCSAWSLSWATPCTPSRCTASWRLSERRVLGAMTRHCSTSLSGRAASTRTSSQPSRYSAQACCRGTESRNFALPALLQTAAVFAANAFLIALQWVTYSATNAGLPVYEAYPGHVRSLVSFFQV